MTPPEIPTKGEGWEIRAGDCREVLAGLEPDSIDAIVTDPPYGIGFMDKEWDVFSPTRVAHEEGSRQRKTTKRPASYHGKSKAGGVQGGGVGLRYDPSAEAGRRFGEWCRVWGAAALRVAKPGAHLIAFGGTRTVHRLIGGLEDAGWEVRDMIAWLFGQGMPKAFNLEGEREGWASALKPALEPAVLCRKPFRGPLTANVALYGTGALHVEACELPIDEADRERWSTSGGWAKPGYARPDGTSLKGSADGSFGDSAGIPSDRVARWPPNVCLDEDAAAQLDAQAGERRGGAFPAQRFPGVVSPFGEGKPTPGGPRTMGDSGGASRFMYVAKASRAERDEGLEDFPRGLPLADNGQPNAVGTGRGSRSGPRANIHPTVKPLDLMRWLCRLVTPTGGLVLDPFTGSGSTGVAAMLEHARFLGVELQPEYVQIAAARIRRAASGGPLFENGGAT